jgi:hypothetical protein
MKGNRMRRITIVLACAMIAPLAFGQATISKQMEGTGIRERAPTQITTGAVKIGTVTAFDAGLGPLADPSLFVVQSSPDVHPVSYVLAKRVRFVAKDGRAIDPHLVRAGTRVELGFDRRGRVSRVVVVER